MEINEIISSGLLELYALGMTSPEESVQVEAWLDKYPEAVAELDKIQAGIESYATAHAVKPSEGLKERIMSQIQFGDDSSDKKGALLSIENLSAVLPEKEKQQAAVYTLNTYFKWAAAACFILLLGSLVLTYTYYNKYKSATNDLSLAQSELNQQKQMASKMDEEIGVMTNKDALPVLLKGTDHAPQASAKIFWVKNTGDVYVAPGSLPQPPAGKQYQLWAIIDGQPVDAGMLMSNNGSIYRFQKMKSFGKAQAFAITLEKEGGSEKPTMTEMYVMAEI